MTLRIGEVDRFGQAAHQPDDTFVERQRNRAAARLFQAARRHQVVATPIVIGEVNRADLGLHRQAYFVDQNVECFIQTRCTRHFFLQFRATE